MEVIVSELSYELQLFNAEYNYYYHHFLPYAFASNKYSNEFSFSNRVFNGALSIRLCIDSKIQNFLCYNLIDKILTLFG